MAFVGLGRSWLLLLLTSGFQHSADALQTHVDDKKNTQRRHRHVVSNQPVFEEEPSSATGTATAAAIKSDGGLNACTESETAVAMKVFRNHTSLKDVLQQDPNAAANVGEEPGLPKWTAAMYQPVPESMCEFRGNWSTTQGLHVGVDSSMPVELFANGDPAALPGCFYQGWEACWQQKGAAEPDDTPGILSTFMADNGTYKFPFQYKTYVPPQCTPGNSLFKQPCPLLVFLNGTDRGVVSRMLSCQRCQEEMGVVTLLPSLGSCSSCTDGSCSWGDCDYAEHNWAHPYVAEEFLRKLVQQSVKKYASEGSVDASQVIIAGGSMGAVGAMYLAFSSPDIFSMGFFFSPTNFGSPYWMEAYRKEVEPLYRQRSASLLLQRVYTTIGSEDTVCISEDTGTSGAECTLDWHNLAVFHDHLGVFQHPIHQEFRVLDEWSHETWPGGIHQYYSFFWQGQPVGDGLTLGSR